MRRREYLLRFMNSIKGEFIYTKVIMKKFLCCLCLYQKTWSKHIIQRNDKRRVPYICKFWSRSWILQEGKRPRQNHLKCQSFLKGRPCRQRCHEGGQNNFSVFSSDVIRFVVFSKGEFQKPNNSSNHVFDFFFVN